MAPGPPRIREGGSPVALLLLLLLSADLAFVGLHLAHVAHPFFADRKYSIETDRGIAEAFQYIKAWWLILLAAGLWWRAREPLYAAWAVIFAYLLADDALGLHETLGAGLAGALGLEAGGPLALRGADLGELLKAGIAGLTAMALLAVAWRRSRAAARAASADLLCLLGIFGFFAVGIDGVHAATGNGPGTLAMTLAVLEEGGEMAALSLTCAYAFGLAWSRGRVQEAWLARAWRGAADGRGSPGAGPGRANAAAGECGGAGNVVPAVISVHRRKSAG